MKRGGAPSHDSAGMTPIFYHSAHLILAVLALLFVIAHIIIPTRVALWISVLLACVSILCPGGG